MRLIISCLLSAGLAIAPIFTSASSVSPPDTTTEESMNLSVTVTGPSVTPTPTPTNPPSGGGGGGTLLPPAGETTVVLQGKAYPGAFVTFLKDSQVSSTLSAEKDGKFEAKLRGLQGGVYTFGVYAEDPKGRKSLTLSFTINVIGGMTTTVSGIFIPPTIVANRDVFYPDEQMLMDGYAFPLSNVNLVTYSDEAKITSTQSGNDGVWKYAMTLSDLELGDHSTRAKNQAPDGDQSGFSETRLFRIIPKGMPMPPSPTPVKGTICRGADLNFDGRVNLTDFSIMLYWWQSRSPGKPCVDINKDGIVNIIDFSVMMYQWKE
jgi:hypothetical protein